MRLMKLVLLCAAALVFGGPVLAEPFDGSVLRGPAIAYDNAPVAPPARLSSGPAGNMWGGVYVGGSLGIGNAGMNFEGSTSAQITHILREDVVGTHVDDWITLGKADNNKTIYGGFVGFNSEWDEIILGAELNYSRPISKGFYAASSDSITRQFNDDAVAPAQHHYFYTATVGSEANARLIDYATVRARAGVAIDNFLPYAFGGLALGRADIYRSATVSYLRHDIPDVVAPPTGPLVPIPDFTFGPQTESDTKNNTLLYGYAAGLGMDIALMPNVFVRAEMEYVQFIPAQDVKIHVSTGRVGVGLKF